MLRCCHICRLTAQGARLHESDVQKLDTSLKREVAAIDLTADMDDEEGGDVQGQPSTSQEQGVVVLRG
jgi:hypothetical protein